MAQQGWPTRYEVKIVLGGGGEMRRSVLTWLGPEKAVALAVQDALSGTEAIRIYDVEVVPLGPAPTTADRTVDVRDDLHDRFEF